MTKKASSMCVTSSANLFRTDSVISRSNVAFSLAGIDERQRLAELGINHLIRGSPQSVSRRRRVGVEGS